MATSLVKFSNQTTKNGKQLLWGRASEDGFPFRTVNAPLLTEDEYQERVVRVADFCLDFFDMLVPAERQAYCEVMERCANNWYALHHIDYFWNQTSKHYVEWFEYYMEDGTRTPASQHAVVELPNGHANGHQRS